MSKLKIDQTGMNNDNYSFTDVNIHINDDPGHDVDITLEFPSGKQVIIQLRPTNAEPDINYNGSMDIILPEEMCVTNWSGDMEPAKALNDLSSHERIANQLVMELLE